MSRNARVAALGVLSFTLFVGVSRLLRPSPDELTPADAQRVLERSLERIKKGGPNQLHMRRLYFAAEPFGEVTNLHVVRAAALLHDATKEDGKGDPKERFCTHGEQGGAWASQVLRELGKSDAFAARVEAAIVEHMGPCGHNEAWGDARFMTKFCQRAYAKPSTAEARLLYDLDMLDLMTVEGVVKVVELRQTNPEFEREPLKDSALTGKDSAWKSVNDAQQTLIIWPTQACGQELVTHTKRFLDGVDWDQVKDVTGFKQAAEKFLEQTPYPACVVRAPPGEDVD